MIKFHVFAFFCIFLFDILQYYWISFIFIVSNAAILGIPTSLSQEVVENERLVYILCLIQILREVYTTE